MLDSALKFAGLHWPILPVKPNKAPATWHGVQDATTDKHQIEAWYITNPTLGIALATGSVSEILVVDFDLYKPGVAEQVEKFKVQYGFIDSPVRARTGRGGEHHFFRIPENEIYGSAINFKGFTGIDLKGEDGYIILPPSSNQDGIYTWFEGCSPFEVPVLPLAPAFLKKTTRSVSLTYNKEAEKERWAQTARNNSLTAYGGRLRAAGMEYDSILTELISANESKFKHPLAFNEVEKIAASVCRYPDYPNTAKLSEDASLPIPENSTPYTDNATAVVIGRPKTTKLFDDPSSTPVEQLAVPKRKRGRPKKVIQEPPQPEKPVEPEKPIEPEKSIPQPEITKNHSDLNTTDQNIPRWKDILRFPATDVGRAELIEFLNPGNIKYNQHTGKFHLWNGFRWQRDEQGKIYSLLIYAARLLQQASTTILDEKEQRQVYSKAIGFENLTKLTACLSLLKTMKSISTVSGEWDTDPALLGAANGVVNLRDGTLLPGRKDVLISLNTNVNYNPEATCPRWQQFLEEVFQGDSVMIDYVQKAAGYTLTGMTTEQAIFLLVGEGSNGKSVFLNTLMSVMGNYAMVASFSTFEKQINSGSQTHDLAALLGCRLVTSSETAIDTVFNEARLKMLSGGEIISARHLYQESFNYRPALKLFLSVNHLPKVKDSTYAFWRRIKRIDFKRTFTEQEADPDLAEKLQAESEGILAWLIQGAKRWFEERLTTPESVRQAVESYKNSTNEIDDFLTNQTEPDPDSTGVSGELLYMRYISWSRSLSSANALVNKEVFYKLVEQRLQATYDNLNRLVFRGIKLIHDTREPNIIIRHQTVASKNGSNYAG